MKALARSLKTHGLKSSCAGALVWALASSACASKVRDTERGSTPEPGLAAPPTIVLPPSEVPVITGDPFALLGIQPNHGPFTGGQRVVIRGNGFTPEARVWFGDRELDQVQAVSPQHVQVVTPSGMAGPVDVTTQNGEDQTSRRTLIAGYAYDPFFVTPETGPTSGGTTLRLVAQAGALTAATQVFIDLAPCTDVTLVSSEELTCTTPAGTRGSKTVKVINGELTTELADGFSYADTQNNFRGGLSGNPLNGQLNVLLFGRGDGSPIAGAYVIVGQSQVVRTDASGRASLAGPEVTTRATLTVAAPCFQPMTLVDVPVETATLYLDPVLSPACGDENDTRLTGGSFSQSEFIDGALVWPGPREFTIGGWTNVPPPKGNDEEYVAYVFSLASDPTSPFVLPETYDAVTSADFSEVGYRFSLLTRPSTLTLYALAGIQNRKVSPPIFTAYSMGIAPGVRVIPDETTKDVFLPMNIPLDQAVPVQVQGPELTFRGPNRMQASVAVGYGDQGFIILPGSAQKSLYPASEPFQIVGLPALNGNLGAGRYVASASVFTGEVGGVPRARGALLETRLSSELMLLDKFVGFPKLTSPAENTVWNGNTLSFEPAAQGIPADITVVDISSGAGLYSWKIVLPKGATHVDLPPLSTLAPDLGIARGPISARVSSAHLEGFDYGKLAYGDLSTRAWKAYAEDVVQSRLANAP